MNAFPSLVEARARNREIRGNDSRALPLSFFFFFFFFFFFSFFLFLFLFFFFSVPLVSLSAARCRTLINPIYIEPRGPCTGGRDRTRCAYLPLLPNGALIRREIAYRKRVSTLCRGIHEHTPARVCFVPRNEAKRLNERKMRELVRKGTKSVTIRTRENERVIGDDRRRTSTTSREIGIILAGSV